MKKIPMVVLMAAVSIIFISGCGKCEKARDKVMIAKIDKYEMTADDFKSGVLPDIEKTKEELLDELITKKILLAEAQKQNFDKERAFMREIERYWEQALLKLLYQKKSEELARGIRVDERDVLAEYDRLIKDRPDIASEPTDELLAELREDLRGLRLRRAIDAWVDGLRSRARIKVNKENLAKVDID